MATNGLNARADTAGLAPQAVAAGLLRHPRRLAIDLSRGRGRRNEGSERRRSPRADAAAPQDIAAGVSGLTVYESNVYFIQTGSDWVLIDTAWAWGGCDRRIQEAAAARFGPSVRPAAIVLTHLHPDHSGSALALARAWDCPVYVHPRELALAVARDLSTVERYANSLDRRVLLPLLRALPRRRVEAMLASTSLEGVVRALDPAAIPELPGWACIPTPGHSPGHIALFRERDRVLLAGDAVLTVDATTLRGWLTWGLRLNRPHVFGAPRYTNWDQRAAEASVAVLAALSPRVLATGHGAPMAGEAVARELRAFAARSAGAGQPDDPPHAVAAGRR